MAVSDLLCPLQPSVPCHPWVAPSIWTPEPSLGEGSPCLGRGCEKEDMCPSQGPFQPTPTSCACGKAMHLLVSNKQGGGVYRGGTSSGAAPLLPYLLNRQSKLCLRCCWHKGLCCFENRKERVWELLIRPGRIKMPLAYQLSAPSWEAAHVTVSLHPLAVAKTPFSRMVPAAGSSQGLQSCPGPAYDGSEHRAAQPH